MPDVDILSQLYEIQFDEPCDLRKLSRFHAPMLDYRLTLARSGHRTVSRAAIAGWLRPKGIPPKVTVPVKTAAIRFLHGYLLWIDQRGLVAEAKKSDLTSLVGLLQSYLPSVDSPVEPTGSRLAEAQPQIDPAIVTAVRTIVGASAKIERPQHDDFFRGGTQQDNSDRSYYLMYRFSTNHGAILKSFLAIVPPRSQTDVVYTYNHFIWGGTNPELGSEHVFREANGVIIKFQVSYYLIGYNFTVPVNKRQHPEEYRKRRGIYRKQPNGMELIALEYDNMVDNPELMPGLTMTLASHHQAVVARAVVLHLGTKSSLGIDVIDQMVEPRQLVPAELGQDLVSTVSALQKEGARDFSEYLEGLRERKDWETKGGQQLADAIIRMIDNTPTWERAKWPKRRRPDAFGAIERFGQVPRD
jgi:hypothetical protein